MKICFALVLVLTCFNCLNAQWESTHGPIGGDIYDLKKNDDFLFASTMHGVYRSADGGLSWSHLVIGQQTHAWTESIGINGSTIAVMSYDPWSLFVQKLYISNDNGDSWSETTLPDTLAFGDVAVTDYAIYVLENNDLLISTDGGLTWQNSGLNSLVNNPSSITTFNQQVYVAGYGKLFRSEANADAWTELDIPGMTASADIIRVFDEIIFLRDYGYDDLHFSTDEGQTWTKSTGLDWGNGFTDFVHIGDAYYTNHLNGIWKTDDLGSSWENIVTGNYRHFYKLLDDGNGNIIAGTSARGILRSTDLGQSFHPSNQGLDAAEVSAIAIGNGKLLAGSDYIGLYQYDQAQTTWDTTILLTPQSHLHDIAAIGDKWFALDAEGFWHSDDGGLSWSSASPDVAEIFSFFYFIRLYADGDVLYAGGDWSFSSAPLYISMDFGQNWEPVLCQVGGVDYKARLFARKNDFVFLSDYKKIFHSVDGGQPWEIVSEGLFSGQQGYIVKLFPANNLIFAIVQYALNGERHLYVSYDNGDQWQLAENGLPITPSSSDGVEHLIGVGGTLIASMKGHYDGMYISTDNAQSWMPFNEGLQSSSVGKLAADGTYLYAAVSGQGIWRRSLADLNFQPIAGSIYRDDNNNGVKDNGEAPLSGVLVGLEQASAYAVSDTDGNYKVFADFTQPYLLSAVAPNPYAVANPTNYEITLPGAGKDFGIYFPPGVKDLRVEMTHFGVSRPGFASQLNIAYKNMGTTVMDGSVQLALDPQMEFISAVPAPSQVVGDLLIWDFSSLQLLETRAIKLEIRVPSSVSIGTTLSCTATVEPVANDAAPYNNQDTELLTVFGSFDPNDKRVEPGEELTLAQYEAGTSLTYTIRFQNTGTYHAETVRIADELSPLLDVSSFQFLASSHPCTFEIRNGNLEFVFDMINLPDSTSNELESHGFVKFSVLPKAGLSVGALIQNTASIFFDFNAPIVTNQVSTQIIQFNGLVPSSKLGETVHVYPNPNTGEFTACFESKVQEPVELEIIDLQGRLIFKALTKTNHPVLLELLHVCDGIYFLKGKSNSKLFVGRVAVYE